MMPLLFFVFLCKSFIPPHDGDGIEGLYHPSNLNCTLLGDTDRGKMLNR